MLAVSVLTEILLKCCVFRMLVKSFRWVISFPKCFMQASITNKYILNSIQYTVSIFSKDAPEFTEAFLKFFSKALPIAYVIVDLLLPLIWSVGIDLVILNTYYMEGRSIKTETGKVM